MTEVTKDQFFDKIGPSNVSPSPDRMETLWKTPMGAVVGKTTPGYLLEGDRGHYVGGELNKRYYLA